MYYCQQNRLSLTHTLLSLHFHHHHHPCSMRYSQQHTIWVQWQKIALSELLQTAPQQGLCNFRKEKRKGKKGKKKKRVFKNTFDWNLHCHWTWIVCCLEYLILTFWPWSLGNFHPDDHQVKSVLYTFDNWGILALRQRVGFESPLDYPLQTRMTMRISMDLIWIPLDVIFLLLSFVKSLTKCMTCHEVGTAKTETRTKISTGGFMGTTGVNSQALSRARKEAALVGVRLSDQMLCPLHPEIKCESVQTNPQREWDLRQNQLQSREIFISMLQTETPHLFQHVFMKKLQLHVILCSDPKIDTKGKTTTFSVLARVSFGINKESKFTLESRFLIWSPSA